MAIKTTEAARALAAKRWAGVTAAERRATGAALAAARAAAGCYSPELQRQRALAGWATRRRKKRRTKK